MKTMRAHKHWLPVVLWMGFIFAMSSSLGSAAHTSRLVEPLVLWLKPDASREQIEFVHFLVRKLGHLSEYAMLAFLTLRAIKLSRRPALNRWSWQMAGATLLIAAVYAATDEWHQTFVPGRTPAFHDVLIDSTGALIGLTLVFLWTTVLKMAPRTSIPVGP